MADPTGTSRPGLSVHEAAVILGVSPNTVRRRVIAGSLRSERIPRPQGEVIRVYLDHVPDEVPKQVPPEVVPGDVPNEVPPISQPQVPDAVRAEVMAALISASIAPVLAPLVAQLEADRQMIERQTDTIRDQAETIGRQGTELERAASTIVALGEENAALRVSYSPAQGQQTASSPDLTREPLKAAVLAVAPWAVTALAIVALIVVVLAW